MMLNVSSQKAWKPRHRLLVLETMGELGPEREREHALCSMPPIKLTPAYLFFAFHS